jgi:cytochrome c biogenesis protein CcmG/thiol:disulfide interchange protein DsbE
MRLIKPSTSSQIFLYGGLAVLIAAALVVGFVGRDRAGVTPVAQRKPMPPLTLELIHGGAWRLADHRGQVIAINYWASWCAPCWEETPMLEQLSHKLGGSGFEVVGVAVDEHASMEVPQGVTQFIDRLHVTYPMAITAPMSQLAYGMDGLPTTILVDRRGRVARTFVGALRESQFRADVESLLRESSTPEAASSPQRQ